MAGCNPGMSDGMLSLDLSLARISSSSSVGVRSSLVGLSLVGGLGGILVIGRGGSGRGRFGIMVGWLVGALGIVGRKDDISVSLGVGTQPYIPKSNRVG